MKYLIALVSLMLSLNVLAQEMPGGGGMGNGGAGMNDGPGLNNDGAGINDDVGAQNRYGVTLDLKQQACAQLYSDYRSQNSCTELFVFDIASIGQYISTLQMTGTFNNRVLVCTVSVLSQAAPAIRISMPQPSCRYQ